MSLIQLFCDECHKSNLCNYDNNDEDYCNNFYICSCGLVECDDCYEKGDTYFQDCAGCHERLCEGCMECIFEDDYKSRLLFLFRMCKRICIFSFS